MKQESGLASLLVEGSSYRVSPIASKTDYIVVSDGSKYLVYNSEDVENSLEFFGMENTSYCTISSLMTLPNGAKVAILESSGQHLTDGMGYRAMLEKCENDFYEKDFPTKKYNLTA